MKPHEWLLLAVETAVIVVSLLHIYIELRKRKEIQSIRIIFWPIEDTTDVEKEDEQHAET